jgi:hypothetical protein
MLDNGVLKMISGPKRDDVSLEKMHNGELHKFYSAPRDQIEEIRDEMHTELRLENHEGKRSLRNLNGS